MTDIAKLGLLRDLNPWWITNEIPTNLIGIERTEYLNQIKNHMENEEIEIITGIRRAGKTTILYQAIRYLLEHKKIAGRNIMFINCDETVVKDNFDNILDIVATFNDTTDGKKYIFLDEVQYFENWEQQLKNIFDRYRKNIKLIISGSTAILLRSKNFYFLTGRFVPIHVYPFSFKEFLEINNIKVEGGGGIDELYKKYAVLDLDRLLQQYIIYGGFPSIVLEGQQEEKIRTAKLYYETILYKDIVKLWEIKDVTALERIGRFILQNIGQRFSYRKIADSLQINLKTSQNYIEYLSNSFLVYFITYYAKSASLQIKKEKKVFTIDNILHTSYFGYDNIGSLAENIVFIHLTRNDKRVNYWKNGNEIDFIIEEKGVPLPIEVKYQQNIGPGDLKGFYSFFKHYEEANEGLLITKNKFDIKTLKDGRKIKLIPLWLFLLLTSSQQVLNTKSFP